MTCRLFPPPPAWMYLTHMMHIPPTHLCIYNLTQGCDAPRYHHVSVSLLHIQAAQPMSSLPHSIGLLYVRINLTYETLPMIRTAPGEQNVFPVEGATGVYKGAK